MDYSKSKDILLRENLEEYSKWPNDENLLNILIPYHTHAEIMNDMNPDMIVYREEDVKTMVRAAFNAGMNKK